MLRQTEMLKEQYTIDFTTPSFYNSVGAFGLDLKKFEKRSKSLEYFILAKIFKQGKEYSPYDVLEACKKLEYKTKETSVRRALFNLQTDKWDFAIVATGKKDNSEVPNNTYKLK